MCTTEISVLPNLYITVISDKIPMTLFREFLKILQFVWNHKTPRMVKAILRGTKGKEKVRERRKEGKQGMAREERKGKEGKDGKGREERCEVKWDKEGKEEERGGEGRAGKGSTISDFQAY